MDETSLPPAAPAPTPAEVRLAYLFRKADPASADAWASEALRAWLAAYRRGDPS